MTPLRGGIPRALASHRSRDGSAYGSYCRAKVARLGGALPADARPWLKAAGLLVVDLDRLRAETEEHRAALLNGAGRRLKEKLRAKLRQSERREARLLQRLADAEARLERLAGGNAPADDLAVALAAEMHGARGRR